MAIRESVRNALGSVFSAFEDISETIIVTPTKRQPNTGTYNPATDKYENNGVEVVVDTWSVSALHLGSPRVKDEGDSRREIFVEFLCREADLGSNRFRVGDVILYREETFEVTMVDVDPTNQLFKITVTKGE